MKTEMEISEKKISNLTKRVRDSLCLDEEEAKSLIYEEWDLIEILFHKHTKVKAVHKHLMKELNHLYRIA